MLKITQGYLCYNSEGELGLVLSKKKVKTSSGLAYTGIHLGKNKFGLPWQEKNPHIVSIIDLHNGNIKIPGVTETVILPNSILIKVIPAHEYGLGVPVDDEEEE